MDPIDPEILMDDPLDGPLEGPVDPAPNPAMGQDIDNANPALDANAATAHARLPNTPLSFLTHHLRHYYDPGPSALCAICTEAYSLPTPSSPPTSSPTHCVLVVDIPGCKGHHFHLGCLLELMTSGLEMRWSCPFCRSAWVEMETAVQEGEVRGGNALANVMVNGMGGGPGDGAAPGFEMGRLVPVEEVEGALEDDNNDMAAPRAREWPWYKRIWLRVTHMWPRPQRMSPTTFRISWTLLTVLCLWAMMHGISLRTSHRHLQGDEKPGYEQATVLHSFETELNPSDLLWMAVQLLWMAVMLMVVQLLCMAVNLLCMTVLP